MSDEQEARIVAARMRLRERFDAKNSSLVEQPAMGTGPENRHGKPKLPPGQHAVSGWPVLDLGRKPKVALEDWRLEITGACHAPRTLTWSDYQALPMVEEESDFHCVTTWSKYDMCWKGVRFVDLAALAEVDDDAVIAMCHGYDGYTTNVPLMEALKNDVLIAFEVDGQPLSRDHGGPARMITPQLYAWKGAKWISKIEFLKADQPGFWEERGYSMSARPWEDDRYR